MEEEKALGNEIDKDEKKKSCYIEEITYSHVCNDNTRAARATALLV